MRMKFTLALKPTQCRIPLEGDEHFRRSNRRWGTQGGGTTEYRLLNRDRNYIWIRDTFRVIRDDAGRPLELVGSWADIMFGPQKESPIQIESEALARDKRDAPH
jgi:PAS domain-containing protein